MKVEEECNSVNQKIRKATMNPLKKVMIEVCLPACSAEMTMRCGLEKSYSSFQDDNDMVAIAYAREVKKFTTTTLLTSRQVVALVTNAVDT